MSDKEKLDYVDSILKANPDMVKGIADEVSVLREGSFKETGASRSNAMRHLGNLPAEMVIKMKKMFDRPEEGYSCWNDKAFVHKVFKAYELLRVAKRI